MDFVQSLFGLKGKVAAVIGGGGVLAGAMADGLARAGADVAILDLSVESAQKRTNALKSIGVKSIAVEVDASSKADLEGSLKQVVSDLGGADMCYSGPGWTGHVAFVEPDAISRTTASSVCWTMRPSRVVPSRRWTTSANAAVSPITTRSSVTANRLIGALVA